MKIYKLVRSCIAVFAVMMTLDGYAQNATISGRVVSSDSPDGLPGVTVLVKGTSTGTITDIDGNYSLSASTTDVLVFNFLGYKQQEVAVGGKAQIDVSLELDATEMEEVVVIGYGEQNRRDLTGSVASVKSEQLAQATPLNALEGMKGRMAGVNITANGGPGENSEINIRGVATFTGGTDPLYVVDGQQMDNIDNLNPSDIASIEVLKDGSSAAIYGARSANGVIIVTTKAGKAGAVKIDASFVRSYSVLASKIPVANTLQTRTYLEGRRGNLTEATTETPSDSLSFLYNTDFDLQEAIAQVGIRDQVSLSVSGGTDKAKFYWNNAYMTQEGVILNTYFDRISSTLKVDFKINDRIKAGSRILGTYTERNGLNEGSVLDQIATHYPFLAPTDSEGNYLPQISSQQNVVAEALFTTRKNRTWRGQIFNYLTIDILPGLEFKTTLGTDTRFGKRDEFNPTITQPGTRPPSGVEQTTYDFSYQFENYVTYKKKFGDHNVKALIGTQAQEKKGELTRLESITFNNDLIETFNNVNDLTLGPRDTRTEKDAESLFSVFGRANYDYKSKYLFATTIRRDGSSRFGEENQYGTFISGQAGWRISDEVFMDPLSSVLTDMKFRVGFSQNGNDRIGLNDRRTIYAPGLLYNGVNGIAPTNRLGNPAIQWEETNSFNYGVDMELFSGRLSASVDYYIRRTDELLFLSPTPSETGFGDVRNNVGSIRNSGLEVVISGTPVAIGDFEWYSSFNIATNKNKVLDIDNEDGRFFSLDNTVGSGSVQRWLIEEGGSVGDFYGYTVEGVFAYDESNAFDDDGNQLTPIFDEDENFIEYQLNGEVYAGNINQLTYQTQALGAGNVIWKDHNGDFDINPADDRSVIGNALPEFFGGFYNDFKYKGWKLSVMFEYNFGNDIYRKYDEVRDQRLANTVVPSPDRIQGAWFKPGDVAEYPTLVGAVANNVPSNTRYVNDGDFIKLRTLRLDYQFPSSIVNKAKILRNASMYFSANNLLTWTNYEGYNPELGNRGNTLGPGVDGLRYPLYREFLIGLNIAL